MTEKSSGWLARLVNRLKSEPPESAWSAAEKAGRAPARRSPAGETVAGDRGRAPLAGDVAEVFSPGPGDWAPDQELLDDFVVDRALGEGGMGKVYLVHSKSTGSRFAVKRAKGLRQADRRSFLAELQHWIDLPDHPNLVACRFFRTVGDEILIFADYVEGGSLQEWIQERRLYEGGPDQALERILDVSIQFAWALNGLHSLGLVHQDVKPGNVLMRVGEQAFLQGVRPQVTDYGLARARGAAGEQATEDPGRNLLISSRGGTRAYWSPEQAVGRPVNAATDTWAWAVSVLEMFVGEVSWPSGTVAPHFLKDWIASGGSRRRSIPAMPAGVADLLEQCFREDPAERPASLANAAERLKAIYRGAVGREYGRALPVVRRRASHQVWVACHRSSKGGEWMDPQAWLEAALKAAGRDPSEAKALAAGSGASRRGDLVAQLAALDEAQRLFDGLVKAGQRHLELELAMVCADKAQVHNTAGDTPGAMHEFDRAIEIVERLMGTCGDWETASLLTAIYVNKGSATSSARDQRGAIRLYDRAIQISERLVGEEGHPDLSNLLAMAVGSKAAAMGEMGDYAAATALHSRAIDIWERLVNEEDRREFCSGLAKALDDKANTLMGTGHIRNAIALYDRAREILEPLVTREGHEELAVALASCYGNRALAMTVQRDNRGAIALYDRAIEILEPLVNDRGYSEVADVLATSYYNKGNALYDMGDLQSSLGTFDHAIEVLDRLVGQEDRRDLACALAKAYSSRAWPATDAGDTEGAIAGCDRAIAILERVVEQQGHREFAENLAIACGDKARVMIARGDAAGAIALCNRAVSIYEREVSRGRLDLESRLEATRKLRQGLVSDSGAGGGASPGCSLVVRAIAQRMIVGLGATILGVVGGLLLVTPAAHGKPLPGWMLMTFIGYSASALTSFAVVRLERSSPRIATFIFCVLQALFSLFLVVGHILLWAWRGTLLFWLAMICTTLLRGFRTGLAFLASLPTEASSSSR